MVIIATQAQTTHDTSRKKKTSAVECPPSIHSALYKIPLSNLYEYSMPCPSNQCLNASLPISNSAGPVRQSVPATQGGTSPCTASLTSDTSSLREVYASARLRPVLSSAALYSVYVCVCVCVCIVKVLLEERNVHCVVGVALVRLTLVWLALTLCRVGLTQTMRRILCDEIALVVAQLIEDRHT